MQQYVKGRGTMIQHTIVIDKIIIPKIVENCRKLDMMIIPSYSTKSQIRENDYHV